MYLLKGSQWNVITSAEDRFLLLREDIGNPVSSGTTTSSEIIQFLSY